MFYDIILPFLQVVSPITGQEIGMQEVRVAKNRETIRGMNVRILTGLGLDVQADPVQRGRYVLRTSYSQLLSSKYQVSAIVYIATNAALPSPKFVSNAFQNSKAIKF